MTSEDDASPDTLSNEQLTELETLSGMHYNVKELAMYFNKSEQWMKDQLNDAESPIHYHFERGKLLLKAKIDIALMNSAEAGNVTSIQMLKKRNAEIESKAFRDKLLL